MSAQKTASAKSRRPARDTADYGKHVHIHLKAAFGLIKKSMKDELFMPAYVTAFSIVEDRLFAIYVVAKRVVEGEMNVERNFRISLLEYADYLIKNEHLDRSIKATLKREFDLRNRRFHGAMWRLDEFNLENTTQIVNLARAMTDLRNKQRKKFGNGLVAVKV